MWGWVQGPGSGMQMPPKLPLPATAGEGAQPEPRGSRLQRGHMLEPSQKRSEKVSKQAFREAFLKSP